MVTHASLAAHSAAMISFYGITPQDRALQFASRSFDLALEEIVATLLAGATLARHRAGLRCLASRAVAFHWSRGSANQVARLSYRPRPD